jgi:glycosyltransferase involved in cell wall biosynthesis
MKPFYPSPASGPVPVSIVLVTYNRASRLEYAIKDILMQTYRDFELIICDDCSPDHTQEICTHFSLADKRVKYVRNETNLGMPENLNQGIRLSKYEYIAILHDADRYESKLIETWYEALQENPNVAFTFYRQALIDNDGQIVSLHRNVTSGGIVSGKYLLRADFFRRWAFDSPVFGMSMVRKSLLEKNNYFNPDYGFYADVDMWMTLLHDWDAFYVDQPLIKSYQEAHQFDDNMWRIGSMMQEVFFKHRELEFQQSSQIRKSLEILLHYIFCYMVNLYKLTLLLKHRDVKFTKTARKYIVKDTPLLLPIWQMVNLALVFYV